MLAIYRTHDSDLDRFTNTLGQYYNTAARDKTYLLIGDTNVNIIDLDNKTGQYLNSLFEAGFLCSVSELTRVASDSRNWIDHVFVNHNDYWAFYTAVIQIEITDHCSVFVEVQLPHSDSLTRRPTTYLDNRLFTTGLTRIDVYYGTGLLQHTYMM